MNIIKKLIFLSIIFLIPVFIQASFAQSPSPTPTAPTSTSVNIPECAEQKLSTDQCIEYLKNKINEKPNEQIQ